MIVLRSFSYGFYTTKSTFCNDGVNKLLAFVRGFGALASVSTLAAHSNRTAYYRLEFLIF